MFSRAREIDMTGRVISAYHFSKDGDFAGVTVIDVRSGQAFLYLTEYLEDVQTFNVDEAFLELKFSRTSRLVGFRSALRCRQSQVIRQIQPIYYSIDKRVCKN